MAFDGVEHFVGVEAAVGEGDHVASREMRDEAADPQPGAVHQWSAGDRDELVARFDGGPHDPRDLVGVGRWG